MIHLNDKISYQPQPRSCFNHGVDFVYADYLIRYSEAIFVRNRVSTFHLTKPVCEDCLEFESTLMETNHGEIEVIRIEYPPMTPKQREVFRCPLQTRKRYQRTA